MNAPDPIALTFALSSPTAAPSQDTDPQETEEWRDAFTALVAAQGPIRARQILDSPVARSREQRVGWQSAPADG